MTSSSPVLQSNLHSVARVIFLEPTFDNTAHQHSMDFYYSYDKAQFLHYSVLSLSYNGTQTSALTSSPAPH